MSSESQKQRKVKLTYISQNLLPKEVLAFVIIVANRFFAPFHNNTDSINALILEVATLLHFDRSIYNGILQENTSAQDKWIKFSSLFQNCDNQQETSIIEFLLCYENLRQLGENIENELLTRFENQIEIRRRVDPRNITKKTQRRISIRTVCCKTIVIVVITLVNMAVILIVVYISFLLKSSTNAGLPNPLPKTAGNNVTVVTEPHTTSYPPTAATHRQDDTSQPFTAHYPTTLSAQSLYSDAGVNNTANRTRTPLKLMVSSYNEYTQRMQNLPPNAEVILSIKLQSPLDWPTGNYFTLPNSHQIVKMSLGGPISVDILIRILSQTPNVKHLHLRNTGNQLCQRNEGQLNLVKTIKTMVYLPMLDSMVIQDFTSCVEVLEALASHLKEMRRLKGLVFHRSIVDDRNLVFIQEIIQLARKTLRDLHFAETVITTSTPLFEAGRGMEVMGRVRLIRLDSKSVNDTQGVIPVGSEFRNTFPGIRSIKSKYGSLMWKNVSNTFGFGGNLNSLEIGIKVPEGLQKVSVTLLNKRFPALRNASLTLNFETCGSEKKQITGWETVVEPLEYVAIHSNCKIFANFSFTPADLRGNREEEYSNENGRYVFTYRVVENGRRKRSADKIL